MLMVLKKQLKRNRKKGFTLVEVIVVLVILAVLAAIAIPALTGYIDKARDRTLISEGRNIQLALQEITTSQYGDQDPVTWVDTAGNTAISSANTTLIIDEVNNLAGTKYDGAKLTGINTSGTAIESFTFESEDGKVLTYDIDGTPKYEIN